MATGKSVVLHSGLKLTASLVYSAKYTSRGMANLGITIANLAPGSGVEYTVRGYPVEGMPEVLSIASGTVIASGAIKYLALSDPYDQIDIGLAEATTNSSGTATAYVTGKRR